MAARCFRKLADVPKSPKSEWTRILVYLLANDIEPTLYDHFDFFRVYVHIGHLKKARSVIAQPPVQRGEP